MSKLKLIADVVNMSVDEQNYNYYNTARLRMYAELYLVMYYTNITFTEKQKENLFKLYDILDSNGIIDKVISIIPGEFQDILEHSTDMVSNIYEYKNSIYGILDGISQNYDSLKFDVNEIADKISDPKQLTLLKDIVTKIG